MYADFRLAKQSKITGLMTDGGFCVGGPFCGPDTAARADARASFRSTFRDDGSGQYLGINPSMVGLLDPQRNLYQTFRTLFGATEAYYDYTGEASVRGRPDTGTWLVSRSVLTPVPEPTVWAFMLTGFAAIGLVLRRRMR